ncbi:C-terminal binding protein [Dactylosporangium siamense]|uniref:D-isomer specific 2-hydroxyacid dehydrogenase family protein n=1 Tax=Dactylosporangium siamense TaxID=685454 RepID=A0A919PIQ3_9ACTN|nr:C-terminal binding protein [Dactylosporangium siamense]GIG45541.1 D-isomer specific 2-hydroxyacid dehydrogenase family protein [Dactylosporangium siamense]
MTHSDRGTIMIADSDFGDTELERTIVEEAGFTLRAYQCRSEDEVIRHGQDADGIITQYARIGATAMHRLPRCRVIARYGTGVDVVDVEAATRRGIQVTGAPDDWGAEEVADHAIALWLCAARRITEYATATRHGAWHRQTGAPIRRVRGRVFGLLGFGAIAKLITDRARPFGVHLVSHDPFVDDEDIRAYGVRPVTFDHLVMDSDYLIVQAPLTPDTHHLIDTATLARMKPDAILVSTAHGSIIEDAALAAALERGTIAGAALDDLEQQSPDNPLLTLPNVIVTPRAAYYSEQSVEAIRSIAAEEAVRVLNGHAPLSPVNRPPTSGRP